MDLPQTEPGIGAPGLDPTPDELAAIDSITAAFDWIGATEALRGSVTNALGGGLIRLRDLVYIPGPAWEAAVATMRVPVPAVEDVAQDPRLLTAIEQGHVVSLLRIARLRLGLRAIPTPQAAAAQAIVPVLQAGADGNTGVTVTAHRAQT